MGKRLLGGRASRWLERPSGARGARGAKARRRIDAFALTTALVVGLAAGLLAGASGGSEQAPVRDDAARPGGAATARLSTFTRNAFSAPSGNIGFAGELEFKLGNAVFRKLWVSAPASTASSDGLGPLFNARSCQRCHLKDGRGHPPAGPDDDAVSMLLRLSVPPANDDERRRLAEGRVAVIAEPTYGGQLQDFAIQGHAREGRITIAYEDVRVVLAGGEEVVLRRPSIGVADLGYGPMRPDVMLSPRIAPQMIGLGLLEAIPEADILARADPDDRDGDGISGRARMLQSRLGDGERLGRFGWKAGAASILEQSADAFSGDMGLSTSLVPGPAGDCTEPQPLCRSAPDGGNGTGAPEVGDELLRLVTLYAANLGVPPRRGIGDAEVEAGERLFTEIGCATCHTPRHVTGPAPGGRHLEGQAIYPYTDLLLHDMGEGLADERPEGEASGREWRTPPLWGIGLTQVVSGHTFFLHDGRARSLEEAILWHGGEAETARARFAQATQEERAQLIAFLGSL